MGEFEKDIRDMFVELEVPIDTESLWLEVEEKLDKRKRKFGFWWILSGTATLLTILILGITLINNTPHDTKNKYLSQAKSANKNVLINDGEEQTNRYTYIEKNEKVKIEKSQYDKDKIEKNKNYYQNKNETNISINTNTNLKSSSQKTDDNIFKYINNYKKEYYKKNTNSNSIFSNKFNNDKESTTAFGLKNRLKPIEYSRAEVDIVGLIKHQYFDIDGKETISSNFSYAMDFDLGLAFTEKYLQATSQDYKYYEKQRIQTESVLESFCTNMLFNIRHKSGLFVRTGINFTQIDELFSDLDSIDIEKNTTGTTEIFINEEGNAITSSGDLKLIEHKVWNMNVYNYYRFLDIPLHLGYAINFGKAILEIESGISYNILFLRKGQIIGTEGFPIDISRQKDIFKLSTGLNITSGIRFLYPIKEHLFYIEPNFRYSLQKITVEKYPLTQKYLNYGIKLGYRMNF